MLRLFQQHWPGWYRDPARWKTPDGIIPFPLFAVLFRAIEPALALERLNLSRGINLAFVGPEGDGPRLLQETLDEAHPEA